MIPEEVVEIVLNRLEECNIEYMIVGSFASSLYGIPRVTQDADIVIRTNAVTLREFVSGLQKEFYADENMAIESLRHKSMFNLIHLNEGFKVDLIFLKDRPYSAEQFPRRRKAALLGKQRWFASPEDTILAKLEWSALSESERQFNDATTVAEVQKDKLDLLYLKSWAYQLNIEKSLQKLFTVIGEN